MKLLDVLKEVGDAFYTCRWYVEQPPGGGYTIHEKNGPGLLAFAYHMANIEQVVLFLEQRGIPATDEGWR